MKAFFSHARISSDDTYRQKTCSSDTCVDGTILTDKLKITNALLMKVMAKHRAQSFWMDNIPPISDSNINIVVCCICFLSLM